MRIPLAWLALVLPAAAAAAADDRAAAAEGERLVATAARLLGVAENGERTSVAIGAWEPVHAVEGDGLMLRGVDPDICAAAAIQSARAKVRLQSSCHRDGDSSTLIVFVAQ
jgi:hypothetical protein